ncbi:hypothetical protein OG946_22215 [Streptomyces sp. NBC_01808]|uniref:hypothetical protein n=1 Tax=Streptomyces sp. NBC_01808 TaxID=2975947 RepID=UPI002DD844B2|nr:hypothetical protein [Streptomyces sp. NBC_01808]WSA39839.1 hypothetical protein OG946_22215 [Streptomyces sp. NBC_01808]
MLDDDLLVVGFDLETQCEVHIGERPLDDWRSLGYGRRETVATRARARVHRGLS